MTTVGYGDITPGTDRERVFTVIALLVGASAFGYIVGSVFLMLEQIDAVRAEFVDKMDRLNDYVVRAQPPPPSPPTLPLWIMDRAWASATWPARLDPSPVPAEQRYRELPDVLASRLRRHTKHFYSSHTVFDEDSVLNALPRVLRARLLVHSRARMLRSFRLLRTRQEWEPLFLADIARRMLPQFVSEGESLFEEGDLPQYLTILLSGEVELCVTCRHPEHLPASIRAKVCERCPPGAEEPDAAGTPDEGGERGYATEEKEPRANATPDTTGGGGDAGRGVVPMSRYERVEAFAMAGGVAALRCPGSGHERSHAAAVATVTAASGMKRKAWRQRRETNFLFAIRRRGESVGEVREWSNLQPPSPVIGLTRPAPPRRRAWRTTYRTTARPQRRRTPSPS